VRGSAAASPTDDFLGDCAVGAQQFALVCTDCHGSDGKGESDWTLQNDPPPPVPHDLTDTAYMGDLDDAYLYQVIMCGGLSVGKSAYMPAWQTAMSSDQLRGLVCYMREISGT